MAFTDEQISLAHDAAPKIIQDALTDSDGLVIEFIMTLQERYNLHVDVAGLVVEAVRNMVLGLLPPATFIQALAMYGVEDATARKIVVDLNREVFIPLRDAVRAEADPDETAPQVATAVPLVSAPRIELQEPPQAIAIQAPEMAPPPMPQPVASISVPPALSFPVASPDSTAPIAQKIPPSIPVPTPVSTTETLLHSMASDMAHIQQGTYGMAQPSQMTHTLEPEHATPALSFQTGSIPVSFPAPIQQSAAFVSDLSQPGALTSPTPSAEYSSDPYRETF